MTTGIYLIVFPSERYYIGQSVDIENRWKQHFDKFSKGTAAKLMQTEFNRYGFPKTSIILECHKDHLDMMEGMFITSNLGPKILNTTIPGEYSKHEIKIATADADQLKLSTVEILHKLRVAHSNVTTLEEEVEALRDEGIVIPDELEDIRNNNKLLKERLHSLIVVNQELSRKANMSWWERLWS